jgi:hypothetical protein
MVSALDYWRTNWTCPARFALMYEDHVYGRSRLIVRSVIPEFGIAVWGSESEVRDPTNSSHAPCHISSIRIKREVTVVARIVISITAGYSKAIK